MNWSLELCREIAAEHPQVDGHCPRCTRRGVGSNGGRVASPCGVYADVMARRRQLGDPLLAEES